MERTVADLQLHDVLTARLEILGDREHGEGRLGAERPGEPTEWSGHGGKVDGPVASAPEGYFEAAALEAVGKWTYEPEKFDGAMVPSPGIRVLIRFALQ